MADFDVQQVVETAALAMHAECFGSAQVPDGFEHCGHGAQFRREATAALAVIMPAVTEQIRALHQPNPGCSFTPWNGEKVEFDGCKTCGAVRYPCPTLRLCDELAAAARGEQP